MFSMKGNVFYLHLTHTDYKSPATQTVVILIDLTAVLCEILVRVIIIQLLYNAGM